MMSAVQEGWTRVWVHAWKKTVPVRSFAGHELCVARDDAGAFMVFHRRTGWVLRSRGDEAVAVNLAEGWSDLDWDFDEQAECPASTRAGLLR